LQLLTFCSLLKTKYSTYYTVCDFRRSYGQDDLLNFKLRKGNKGDLRDFECGIVVVGSRWAGLSISEVVDLLGFSLTTISKVYKEWYEKEKISSERQFCVPKMRC